PAGSILVAPHPSPVLVKAMDKVNAIVTDTGGIAGHMASIAREFNIPTIADTGNATSVIKHGETITVDATSACVYSGVVKELAGPKPVRAGLLKDTPVYELLKRVSKYIVPLNLTDPSDDRFDPAYAEPFLEVAVDQGPDLVEHTRVGRVERLVQVEQKVTQSDLSHLFPVSSPRVCFGPAHYTTERGEMLTER
ncbi:MAG: PEP-utilizing enzyme, partial [Chloroflexia bacterium]